MDKEYLIKVAYTKVTSDNCGNITGEGIVGKVSYDPTTETLVLNNAIIDGNIYGDRENLNIVLIGQNIINGDISTMLNTKTIKGEGSLEINGIIDCVFEKDTIIENCSIKIKNKYQDYIVFGDEEGILTIKNANLSIDSQGIALSGFKEIKLINCGITYPYNADIGEYDDECVTVYDELGFAATEVVIERT